MVLDVGNGFGGEDWAAEDGCVVIAVGVGVVVRGPNRCGGTGGFELGSDQVARRGRHERGMSERRSLEAVGGVSRPQVFVVTRSDN